MTNGNLKYTNLILKKIQGKYFRKYLRKYKSMD